MCAPATLAGVSAAVMLLAISTIGVRRLQTASDALAVKYASVWFAVNLPMPVADYLVFAAGIEPNRPILFFVPSASPCNAASELTLIQYNRRACAGTDLQQIMKLPDNIIVIIANFRRMVKLHIT